MMASTLAFLKSLELFFQKVLFIFDFDLHVVAEDPGNNEVADNLLAVVSFSSYAVHVAEFTKILKPNSVSMSVTSLSVNKLFQRFCFTFSNSGEVLKTLVCFPADSGESRPFLFKVCPGNILV